MKVFLAKIWVSDAPYSPSFSIEGVFRTQATAQKWLASNGLLPIPETTDLWENPTDTDIYASITEHDDA